jgi:hypothetical protein
VKGYEIVTEIFTYNYLEVEYFDENSKESLGSIVSDLQFETENSDVEDAILIAVWQPHVDPEPVNISGLVQI